MSRFRITSLAPASRTLALTLLLLLPGARVARAANYTWLAGVSGFADDPTRWSPNGLPDSTSYLTYDKAGTYTVTFTDGVPKTHTHSITAGSVTFSAPGTHAMGYLLMGSAGGATAVIDGGNIVGRLGEGTWLSLQNSMLTLEHGAQVTGHGQVGGNDLPTQLNVFGGSRLHLSAGLAVKRFATATVWGTDAATGSFSGVDGGPQGVSVSGSLYATAGSFVDVTGPVYITGGVSGELQSIHIGPGAPAGDSYLDTQSDLIVGLKSGSPSIQLFGIAELNVKDRAWAHVGGMTVVGDSIGDQGCAIRVLQGGRFIASGGLKVFTTVGAGLDLRGGITHLRGGRFQWPANKLLAVSSGAGTPELWISNGVSNVGPNYGSPLITALMVGRGGAGTLRVTRPGTVLPVTGAASLGDSLGGVGTVVVDSSASLAVSGPLSVGTYGNGVLRVRNGAHVSSARLYMGSALTGNGNVEVSGAGSLLAAKDNIHIGGGELGDASTGTLTVDSSATVSVTPTGINPASVTVYPTAGTLVVDNGGTLSTGTLDGRGGIYMNAGTISALSSSIGLTGRLNGHGTLACNLYSSGAISPSRGDDNMGRFNVTGNFSQFSAGRFRVHLGAGGGVLRSDTLAVAGTANLDGTLEIALDPSFQVDPLDTFTVLTCGTRNGTFASITWNGQPLSNQVQVIYEARAVRLVVPPFTASVDPADALSGLRFAPVGGRRQLAFELELPFAAEVEVALYDVTGRHVATLAEGALAAGRHTLGVSSRDRLSSGLYFARAVVRTPERTVERVAKAALVR